MRNTSEDVLFPDDLVLGFDIVGAGLNISKGTSTAYLQSPLPFLVYCLQKSLEREVTYAITCLAYPKAWVNDVDCD